VNEAVDSDGDERGGCQNCCGRSFAGTTPFRSEDRRVRRRNDRRNNNERRNYFAYLPTPYIRRIDEALRKETRIANGALAP